MPEPIRRGQRYMPGLDGLRAIAVLAVVAYHLEFSWAPGGLLGVGVFFTLSGYLITDLLLAQVGRGGIRLKDFWLARARRLLPALFVMLVVVMAWVTVIGPHQPPDFREAVGSAALYFNNWWQIFHDVSYFAAFEAPGPLNHLWSLSVEEQFYIVWPLLLILAVRYVKEPGSSVVRFRLAGLTFALALASAVLMIVLYTPGLDPSRVYYGSDTRALELLVGAALAMIWPSRQLRAGITANARKSLDALGIVGLAVIALMFWQSTEFSPFLYRGGFLVLSIATALAVATLAHPASRLARVVGCPPMRWIGERSYGIYLWHFPIIILTTPEGAQGADLPRAVLQVAAIIGISALSWKYVEDPIRHGALGRLWRRWREGRWGPQAIDRRGWAIVAGAGAVFVAACAGLAGVGAGPSQTNALANEEAVETTITAKDIGTGAVCDEVVLIGDSTSLGLVSRDYQPNPKHRITARFAQIGIATQHMEISAARSIYERFNYEPNAEDVVRAWKDKGFDGCWVLAMGTNEAANVAAGSAVGFNERIDSMMSAIGDQPVLWVNVKSIAKTGPYAGENMVEWNGALLEACDKYPNMYIYDWASDVEDEWFIPDGIHFTTSGYAQRAKLIADALVEAFPAAGTPEDLPCLIQPDGQLPDSSEPEVAGNDPPTSGDGA